jgi:hypothetical protein
MLAEAYVFDGLPPFPIYLANLAPHKFRAGHLRISKKKCMGSTKTQF